MILSPNTGTRHSQMIAAGRGVKVTGEDYSLAYELLESGEAQTIKNTIQIVIAGYNGGHKVDRFHIEHIRFFHFNYLLDVKNVNFKTLAK